ncbi:MAG TPA: hypothetical protein VNO51_24210 [Ilumatobacteraceae bacterium]|nr:hypothetical protein [Ilumatobacteraceae bacterium]
MSYKQGSIELIDDPIAQDLLSSTVPARVAYVAPDGTPRVLATWFHWTGSELAMGTFIAAPHVHHPTARIAALRQRPDVAITIDTETFPPHILQLRGRAKVAEVDGIDPDYARAAHRFIGDDAADSYLASIDQPGTRMARITVRPTWVGLLDFESRLPDALGGVQGGGND